ncbi:ZapG family protein [Shigella flexneri]
MRFCNRKLRQQQALQYDWKRIKLNWTSIAKSWLATLPQRQLLDTMAHDYRQLYQHMAQAPEPAAGTFAEAKPFRNSLAESEASNNQARCRCLATILKAHRPVRSGANATVYFWAQPLRHLFSPSPTII